MKHIQNFLQQKNHTPVLNKKALCIEIFYKYTQKEFTPEEISFSGKSVFVKCSFEKKYELLLNKKNILEAFTFNKELSFYTDIR